MVVATSGEVEGHVRLAAEELFTLCVGGGVPLAQDKEVEAGRLELSKLTNCQERVDHVGVGRCAAWARFT